VFHQDLDLRYTWVYQPHPHFTPEGLLGKRDEDVLGPQDAAPITALKQRVLTERRPLQEDVVIWVNGNPFYYALSVEPSYDANGSLIGISGASTDITQRKRVEQAQAQELARTRLLESVAEAAVRSTSLNDLGHAVLHALMDHLEMRVGAVNIVDEDRKELCILASVGLDEAFLEAFGRMPLDPESPAIHVRAAANNRVVRDADVPMSQERRRLLDTAHVDSPRRRRIAIPVSASGHVLGSISFAFEGHDEFGDEEIDVLQSVAHILGPAFENARLFEAQQRAEQDLRESEKLFRTLFEYTDDAFQIVELIFENGEVSNFRYLQTNAAFEHQSGLKSSEVVGKTVKEILPNVEP
ncbi:MAG TPA: PAS domain-containing protein, partial [Methanomicrobiales archaeon]|nr:PAS domain-containing protein [Methanomicrobiales archaeon]